MDLGAWLRNLGLERYEKAFRENEIDDTVLPNLTAEDLKDLGVSIVGHRRCSMPLRLCALVTAGRHCLLRRHRRHRRPRWRPQRRSCNLPASAGMSR
jgi:hypothetical protein